MTADRTAIVDSPSGLRCYHHARYRAYRAEALAEAKGGIAVSVCLPARNEEATVGRIVEVIRTELVQGAGLVDEVVVADDGSTDATASVARQAGATVVPVRRRPSSGKGVAMAAALAASRGEAVVFVDADVENFGAYFVVGLLGPLLLAPGIGFVKGAYGRPLAQAAGEGGRVTELLAKPALELFHPELAQFAQPLAGELATYRFVIEGLDLRADYGVDVALLIDVARRIGIGAMAEVDLGERVHRNRPLAQLVPQARSVLRAVVARAGSGFSLATCLDAADHQTGRGVEHNTDPAIDRKRGSPHPGEGVVRHPPVDEEEEPCQHARRS